MGERLRSSMRKNRKIGVITKYLKIGFVLLILIVLVLSTSACITKSPTQEIENETIVNSSYNDTGEQAADLNDTINNSADPGSIPLEKPPFID